MNSTDIEDECPESVPSRTSDILLCIFVPIQTIVAFTGTLANGLLFYAQIKVHNWPFYQRLLCFNVTIAATVASMTHFGQGCYQVIKYAATGNGFLEEKYHWIHAIGDSAQMAVVLSMAVIAFQSLWAIRRCNQNEVAATTGKTKMAGVCMICCIWALAAGFIVGELNPISDIDEVDTSDYTMPAVTFAIHFCIQASVAIAMWFTRRISHRLQVDFAARGAQQNLRTRTHIKETIDLTRTISQVLNLHMGTWLVSFSLAFAFSYSRDRCQDENGLAAYTSLVECVSLGFDFGYPLLVSLKQRQIQRRVKRLLCFCCRKQSLVTEEVAGSKNSTLGMGRTTNSNRIGDVPMPARDHLTAIDAHWRQVAKARGLTLAW